MILSQQCVLLRNLRIFHKHQNMQVFLELSQWPFFNSSWLSYSFVPIWDSALSFLCSLLVVLQECHRHFVNFQLGLEGNGTTRSSVSHRWDRLSRSLSKGENSQDSHPWEHHSSIKLFLWPRAVTHKAQGQYNGVSRLLISFSSLQGKFQSAPRLLQCSFDEG